MPSHGDLDFPIGGRAPDRGGKVESWLLLPCPA